MVPLGQAAHGAAVLTAVGLRRMALRPRAAAGYIGWVGHGNLGDDAMFEAAAKLLAPAHLEIFAGASCENVLARLGLSGSRVFDRVFLGGGTLINAGYLRIVEQAQILGLPVCALGTGVGSADLGETGEKPAARWRDVLNSFSRVGVRGYRSQRKLHHLGIHRVEVIGDLALALTKDKLDPLKDTRRFILNVAAPGARAGCFPVDRMFEEIAQACRHLNTKGWVAIPVAFATADIAPIETTLRLAGLESCAIARPAGSAAYFELAANARFALCVRLHCAVLSACAGLPAISIAYRDKVHDFAETVDMTAWTLDALQLSAGTLAERAQALADSAEGLSEKLYAKAKSWKRRLEIYTKGIAWETPEP